MRVPVVITLLLMFAACSATMNVADHKEMRTQVEHVNDVIMGNFQLTESMRWSEVMDYLKANEAATHNMFEKYETELYVKQNQYLLLLREKCNKTIVMYDYSCTDGVLDGPLYEKTNNGTLYDISAPECAKSICFIR